MAPVLTPGCVFRVNTYLWVKFRTVTCLHWRGDRGEPDVTVHLPPEQTQVHDLVLQKKSHSLFKLLLLLADDGTVGQRQLICRAPSCLHNLRGEKRNFRSFALKFPQSHCGVQLCNRLVVHRVGQWEHHYVLHKEELLWMMRFTNLYVLSCIEISQSIMQTFILSKPSGWIWRKTWSILSLDRMVEP